MESTKIADGMENPRQEVLAPVAEPRTVPATFAQQRLWFLDQLQPGGAAYLVNWSIRLNGELDAGALERALNEVVRRHEIFRTTFASVDGRAMQSIAEWREMPLPIVDVPNEEEARTISTAEAAVPVDLSTGPMLRVKLLRLGPKAHILLVTMHHISFDGSSRAILTREIETLYAAFREGGPSPLPERALQYGDYALWQHRALSGKRYARLLSYWKKQLADAPAALTLPTDRPRPAVETFRGATKAFTFTKALSDAIGELSRRQRASVFMTLLASFQCLLSKYSGQDDIVVGVPVAGRTREELEGLIGLFANELAMRGKLTGDPSFEEVVARAKETALDAYEHQDMPFDRLVQEINPERSLSHNPLFQVLFSVRNYAREVFHLEGMDEVDFSGIPVTTSKFDLSLYFTENPEGLSGWMEYNTDLFDETTIVRMLEHYRVLLEAVAENPSLRLSEMPLLPPAERHTVLVEFNDTAADFPRERSLHQFIEEQVERTPHLPALVFESHELTYAELNARANRLAHRLRKLGVGPESLVAICAERSIELVIGLLGIVKAGGAYVPFDPDYPQDRLAVMLEDAQPDAVLLLERLAGVLPEHSHPTLYLDRDDLSGESAENPVTLTTGKSPAYAIYTSGSTGKPKGVPNVHEGIVNRLLWMQAAYPLDSTDRVLQKTPYSFDVSVWEFFWPLMTGACLVVARPEGHKDPEYLARLIRERKITTLHFVPSMLRIFLEAEGVSGCVSLRRVICSGEALPFDLQERFFERLGAELHNLYGPTEAAVDVTYYHCRPDSGRSIVPIGKPIWNTRIYILDAHRNPVPIGIPGELHIGGVGLARGYLKRPELTAEKFIPDPFSAESGARLYKSGDLARFLPDGNIEYLGRMDFQVKLRGFRIELGEIEAVLEKHPGVRQGTVVVREDEPGYKRLVAYVVPNPEYGGPERQDERQELSAEQVSQWAMAFDEAYRQGGNAADATFNIAGWNNSYTGQPIPPEEMRVWVETTVDRILALHPERVWEIGCGTGLLLFRIAPHCRLYHGTDISSTALHFLQRQLDRPDVSLPQVTLARKPAHERESDAEGDLFDVVVLNSVVQYFPDLNYLIDVLQGAVQSVKPGGTIFLGDVRSLPLLRMFHASVQVYQAPESLTRGRLLSRVEKEARQEGELVIDPEFFTALKQRVPQIERVEIQLKRGFVRNELMRFRYDVLLHVGEVREKTETAWLDWNRHNLTRERLRETLREKEPALLGLSGVPNARLQSDSEALRLLEMENGPATAGELREIVKVESSLPAMEPEDLWAIERDFPYHVEIRGSRTAVDGNCDVLLRRRDAADAAVRFPGETDLIRPWEMYATNPLRQKTSDSLIPHLRSWLGEKLPEYMIPSAFVPLDSMPLSANGKVDRKALPQPEYAREENVAYLPPSTPAEKGIAEIWSDVLHVPRIGVEDNFFALGGHSLLATQVISRIRKAYGLDVPLRALFEEPTVAGLARRIGSLQSDGAAMDVPLLSRVERGGPLPLSFTQQRLWFLDQLDPLNPLYNVTSAIRLQGNLQPVVLEDSLNEIARRHEALRTRFETVNGEPVQIVEPWSRITLAIAPEQDRAEEEARCLAREEARRPFDLTKAPLLRARLIRVAENDHVLVVITHHIVSDGWSFTVIAEELSALYASFLAGEPSPLPELPVQFADYAVWQRTLFAGGRLERQLAYWRKQLTGAPMVLELPADHPRPSTETFAGAKHSVQLPAALLNRLRDLSQKEGVTLFMTLLGAFGVLLSRYSGQDEVLIGSPIAGRIQTEIEKLIGFFVNTLVFRSDVAGNPSVRELLQRIREASAGAYENQDVPFEKLVEELKPERDLSRNPIFQVSLILQNLPPLQPRMGEVAVSPFPVDNPISKFDLTLMITESSAGLKTTVEYNTALFDKTTAVRMLEHYGNVLESMVANPDARVSELRILSDAERTRILVEWNATVQDYPRDLCLHTLFERQAETTPERVAVTSGGRELTYAALNARANRVAHYLLERGAAPDVLIGIRMTRGIDMLAGLLGILKSGAAYVPLDPLFPKERLDFILEDSSALLVLTDENWSRFDAWPTHNPITGTTPAHLAYVLHTSGSTGKPKGVEITHRNVVNFLAGMLREPGLTADDTLLAVTTLSFDIAGLELYLPLVCGAKVAIASREEAGDPTLLMAALGRYGATVMQATPATWRMLVEGGFPAPGMPPLKALCGGEAFPVDLAAALFPRCGELWNMYGPTETTIWSSVYRVAEPPVCIVPLGRPIANTTMYVLDGGMQPVPAGVPGELFIGGDGVGRGYLNRPELTAERFLPDPFVPGARIYRTGDVAKFLPDGNIQYLRRADFQVKLRGFRIELGEIEDVLAKHPSVRQSVVVLRDERLVAYVVGDAAGNVDAAELKSHARASLPDYMVPSAIVAMDALPLTPNGKIDRKALPAPDFESVSVTAPRTPTEELIAGIWSRVLKLESVDVEANFFDLGGHSLVGTQVISRMREAFHVNLPLRALFERPTVAALAKAIALAHDADVPPLVRVEREGPLPLSFAQQRLWFLHQLDPLDTSYNVPYIRRLHGPFDVQALSEGLSNLTKRHEALRTRFATFNEEPVQVIDAWQPPAFTTADAADEEEARRIVREETRRPFHLQTGPLLRALLVRIAGDDHVLVLNMHHSVTDGWSLGVIERELACFYEAALTGKPVALEPLPVRYADCAIWQREYLSGERLNKELAWWTEQLKGAPGAIELPTDRPRPPVITSHGATHAIALPVATAETLRALSRDEGVTLFMTLLASFSVFLARYSGQEEVVVGSVIAGRTQAGVENLVGLFVNTLAMRTSLAGNPTFRELLTRVRETCMGAYAHQDLPFEKLVQALEPERDMSRHPLFQTMLVLQNTPGRDRQFAGLEMSRFATGGVTAKFDLLLSVTELPDGLRLSFEYNTDLFDASTVERMMEHFRILLDSVVRAPEEKVFALPIMSAEERRRVLAEWNRTERPYPNLCVHQLFEEQVGRNSDSVALRLDDRRLTYGELNARADALAGYLRSLGVGRDVPVGIHAERTPETIAGLLGILKAGGAYVPLDPGFPLSRLNSIVRDSGIRIVLTGNRPWAELLDEVKWIVHLDRPEEWEISNTLAAVPDAPNLDSLAYVMYTSGSTGKPKGVAIPHRGIVRLLFGSEYADFGEDKVFLHLAPLAFDASTFEIWGALLHGATLAIFPPGAAVAPQELGVVLDRHGVTTLWLTAALFNFVIEEQPGALSPVKQLLTGGEALSVRHIRRAQEALPHTQFINGYGPTESTTFAACYPIPRSLNVDAPTIPLGHPIANTTIYVLDRGLEPVPTGVTGELYIGGDGLAREYVGSPDLTASKFIPDPFSVREGGRLYATGDRARFLPDGTLDFLGRADDQVKIRGFRIEPGEIEAVLLRHPAIKDCVVLAHERRLIAYTVPVPGQVLDAPELRVWVKESLPEYMVPTVFLEVDRFPLTPNGKVDRKALPIPEQPETVEDYVEPRTPTEDILAAIMADVLRLDRIGSQSNFFELGGHSITATQVMARARQAFEVELPLRDIFEWPTAAGLAAAIDRYKRGGHGLLAPPLTPAPRDRPLPLSFAQQRLWFMAQLEPDNSIYNAPLAMRLTGLLDRNALESALNGLIARHEILRTTYRVENDQPVQVISDRLRIALPVMDVNGEQEAQKTIHAESEKPFDLANGPLLRALLLRLSEREHVLSLCTHHIATDGWSTGILKRDLAALYNAACSDGNRAQERAELQKLPVQYGDYAVWQRRWLEGEVLDRQLSYWRGRLAGAPPILALPTDRPRPALQTYRGAVEKSRLSEELMRAVREAGRKHGATSFMTMLAAFQILILHYTRQTDIVLGADVANRGDVRTEGLIGFFVNLLVIRADLSGNPSFAELLRSVRDITLGAYAHQDVPFDKLVEELQPERSPSHNLLVQVLFVQQNVPRGSLAMTGIDASGFPVEVASKFDMAVFFSESEEGAAGSWVYNPDLFDAATVARMALLYRTVLEKAVEDPAAKISDLLSGLAETERRERTAERKGFEAASLEKLKGIRRR